MKKNNNTKLNSVKKRSLSDVKFTIGGAMEEEASRRFIDTWHRSGLDESFHVRPLAIESRETLFRVLISNAVSEIIVLPICLNMKSHWL
jgi:hypothetical protein